VLIENCATHVMITFRYAVLQRSFLKFSQVRCYKYLYSSLRECLAQKLDPNQTHRSFKYGHKQYY